MDTTMKNAQLADLLRPEDFDGIVGQEHLFGERGVVRRMLAGGRITNMIFFGPPGTGKTTAASIIAKQSGMEISAATANSVVRISMPLRTQKSTARLPIGRMQTGVPSCIFSVTAFIMLLL